ncbi:MAG: hemolysin family protein [Massilia sp.]
MEILIILGLILLNGVFAMAELALVSAKRARLERRAAEGSEGAATALALADEPSAMLSTVQVGITLISIFNGAFGEASLVARLTPQLAAVPLLAPCAEPAALALVVAGITFASIVLGELVPKRIAFQNPELFATAIARPLRTLSRLAAPIVKLLALTTDLIVRLLGLDKPRDDAPTEEEISGVLKEGTAAGVLAPDEYDIVTRALALRDQRLSAVMTPGIDLQLIDLDDPVEHNLERIARSPYSRFPVYRGDRANIVGMVHAGDLFEQAVRNKAIGGVDIGAAVKPLLYVPDSVSAMDLLEECRRHRAELALVVDEHGQVKGLVTLADLMNTLVGEVPGVEERDSDAVLRDDGSWLMDGAIALQRVCEKLGDDFPDPGDSAYQTLAGFVLNQLRHVPRTGDHVDWRGFRFEVVDMDKQRIDRVLVSPREADGGRS